MGEVLPAGQRVQGPPLAPVKRVLQRQEVTAVLPVPVVIVFTGQLKHSDKPVLVLYFAVGHATQGPPLGPVNPALQVQLFGVVLPNDEYEPAGHAMQVPPLAHVKPALQVQEASEPLPLGEVEY